MNHPWNGARILGSAGVGLDDAIWAESEAVAQVGQAGEVATGHIIDAAVRKTSHMVALHDLRIPIPGFSANIDHMIVGGTTLLIIDTKAWKGGFYLTVGGRTYRSWRRFASADKQTMKMASDSIGTMLSKAGVKHSIIRPQVVVRATSGKANTTLLRMAGAKAVPASRFDRNPTRGVPDKPVPHQLISTLMPLINETVETDPVQPNGWDTAAPSWVTNQPTPPARTLRPPTDVPDLDNWGG